MIAEQEREGGRMRQSQMGVVRTDPGEDMRMMIENYTGEWDEQSSSCVRLRARVFVRTHSE